MTPATRVANPPASPSGSAPTHNPIKTPPASSRPQLILLPAPMGTNTTSSGSR